MLSIPLRRFLTLAKAQCDPNKDQTERDPGIPACRAQVTAYLDVRSVKLFAGR